MSQLVVPLIRPALGLVSSPSVTITVAELVPYLSLTVTPSSGVVGDTFTFLGSFLVNDHWLPGRHIDLVLNGKIVGSGTTDSYGDYQIDWVADRAGVLVFHTEGVYP